MTKRMLSLALMLALLSFAVCARAEQVHAAPGTFKKLAVPLGNLLKQGAAFEFKGISANLHDEWMSSLAIFFTVYNSPRDLSPRNPAAEQRQMRITYQIGSKLAREQVLQFSIAPKGRPQETVKQADYAKNHLALAAAFNKNTEKLTIFVNGEVFCEMPLTQDELPRTGLDFIIVGATTEYSIPR